MANMPFELVGRRVMDGALCLTFKCAECGERVSLVIRDTDPLKDRYPVACICGAEVNLHSAASICAIHWALRSSVPIIECRIGSGACRHSSARRATTASPSTMNGTT